MLILYITLLPLLATLGLALAIPDQSISTAGPKHGIRRTHLGKRAGHGGDRGSGCRAKAAATSTMTYASASEANTQGAATATTDSSAVVSSATSSSSTPSSSSYTSSAPAPSGTSATGDVAAGGKALTPNGIKAGMTLCTGLEEFTGKLGWCYDWTPAPAPPSGMEGVPMLWGGGSSSDQHDAPRLAAFKAITTSPKYIMGFEEPDCSTLGSASMNVADAASTWNELVAPHGATGSLLISPSMCKQADEEFLTPFKAAIKTEWDITNLHINKLDMDGVKKDLDHYWDTYKKPMWVTEFACVDDKNWKPCTDQAVIDKYINDIVKLLEEDSRVYAYAYSNGEGLGEVWPAFANSQLTASGKTYLKAIGQYH